GRLARRRLDRLGVLHHLRSGGDRVAGAGAAAEGPAEAARDRPGAAPGPGADRLGGDGVLRAGNRRAPAWPCPARRPRRAPPPAPGMTPSPAEPSPWTLWRCPRLTAARPASAPRTRSSRATRCGTSPGTGTATLGGGTGSGS